MQSFVSYNDTNQPKITAACCYQRSVGQMTPTFLKVVDCACVETVHLLRIALFPADTIDRIELAELLQ